MALRQTMNTFIIMIHDFFLICSSHLPKVSFSEIRVRTWVQVVSRQKNRPLIGWPIHCMYWSSMWHSPSRSFYFCMHYLHDLQPEIQPPNFRNIYLYHEEAFEVPDVRSTSENVVLSGLPIKGLFYGRKPLELMSWLGSRKKLTLGKF